MILYNDDCLKIMDEMIVNGQKVDLIVCDPPYKTTPYGTPGNSGGMFKNKLTMKGKVFENNSCDVKDWGKRIYSLLKDGWVKFPNKEDPRVIEVENTDLFKEWLLRYRSLVSSEDIENFISDLYDLRKTSLKKDGEFSLGNLVFKEFRNRGYLQSLKDRKYAEKSKELTLECAGTDKGSKLIIEGIEINPGINPQIIKERPDWFFNVDLVKSQLEKINIPSDTTVVVKLLSEGFVVEIYKIRKSDGQEVEVWESHIIKTQQLSGYQLDLIKKYVGEKI